MPAPKNPMDPPIIGRRPPACKQRQYKMQRFSFAVFLVVLAIIVCAVVARAVQPLFLIHNESSGITVLQKQLDSERERNRQLKARRVYLSTPQGVQAESRKSGWVKKGEIIYRLADPHASSPNP